MNLEDDGYCFVCGQRNPLGLRLDFSFDGKTIKTEFIPKKEHQGYLNIVHGGIISTLLDEAMIKLAIAMERPALTAHLGVRLKKALQVGQKIMVSAKITKETRRILEAYAKAVTENNIIIAEAKGKLIKIKTSNPISIFY